MGRRRIGVRFFTRASMRFAGSKTLLALTRLHTPPSPPSCSSIFPVNSRIYQNGDTGNMDNTRDYGLSGRSKLYPRYSLRVSMGTLGWGGRAGGQACC